MNTDEIRPKGNAITPQRQRIREFGLALKIQL
jgi:hypothetical protein